jgi:TolA-binding protein
MTNAAAAEAALGGILKMYPTGDLSDNAVLLFGEDEAASGRPESARGLFRQFIKQFPHSELLPQASLAVARTYEQQGNWPEAVTNYNVWLQEFANSDLGTLSSGG